MIDPARLLTLPTVLERVGLARGTFYELMKKGEAPRPVVLGLRSVAWDPELIDQFVASRASRGTRTDWRGKTRRTSVAVKQTGTR